MYIRKWLVLGGVLLLLAAGIGIAWAENDNSVVLTFSGVKVNQEIRVIEKDETRFINLPFLGKYLHVISDWNPTDGGIDLKIGKYSIKMFENNLDYEVNGSPRHLTVAPFQRDNQLWMPVEFLLRLGLVINREDHNHLDLDWDHNYLLGIENIKFQERPAFLLIGSGPFKTKSFLLVKPNRLVVELTGVQAHFSLDCNTGNDPIVKKVRFSQINSDTVRLVFDLKRMVGYQIIDRPEQENQVMVVFNYEVEDISFFQHDGEQKVYIKSSFPAAYNVKTFNAPNRLIIDFEGATLVGLNTPISGDGKWVRRVRMSQFTPQTVRVVLDLIGSDPCFVLHARGNPNLIEVRTVQTINNIKWANTEQGGSLTIKANGELVPEIQKFKNPKQLQIDLDYTQFAANIELPAIKNSQVKGIHLVPLSPTEVRVDVDLAYFVGYESHLSEDRHELTVKFKRSPLIGRSIVLDPGHGGVDPGACGRQGTREKDINLEVTMRLKDLLEEAGAAVVLTRIDDSFIGLYERPFIANYLCADLFISIHTNNHPDLDVQGIEVYHLQGRTDAQNLAKCVLDNMVETTDFKGLGVKVNDFVVIRETQMPSILIELGFLSNFQEEATIKTPEYKDKAAAGIFQGIMGYYQR